MKRRLSHKQIKLIHVAARQLKLIDADGNDENYRTVLWNICHVKSSTKLSQAGFDKLMAFFHNMGFETPTGTSKITRQQWLIYKLIDQLPSDMNLPGVISKATSGRCRQVGQLTDIDAGKVIDALKDIIKRQRPVGIGQDASAHDKDVAPPVAR